MYEKESREFEWVAIWNVWKGEQRVWMGCPRGYLSHHDCPINQDGHPGLWFVLYLVRVFQSDISTKMPPWSLICWDICDFSVTHKQILTKLDRKQVLNVLYTTCVFGPDLSTKMAVLIWLKRKSVRTDIILKKKNLTGSTPVGTLGV